MSLFSDVDWTILLLAGGLLLLGGNNKELFRTAGRLYGKVMRLRDEFLRELRSSTFDGVVPAPPTSRSPSVGSYPPVPTTLPTMTGPVVPAAPGVWSVGEVHRVEPLPADEPMEDGS